MLEPAERGTRARAVDTLKIASAVASYAARSLGNGLEPAEARRAALEAAADLERAAAALRRLARPNPVADPARQDEAARRRAVALELSAAGWPRQAIAERLGVTPETVRRYGRARPAVPVSCMRLACATARPEAPVVTAARDTD